MNEQTFVIIKPDAIGQGLVGKILNRFEDMGLYIERIEKRRKNINWCCQHYINIWNQFGGSSSIYKYLENFMVSKPIIGIVLIGPSAIERVRKMIGTTNALEAEPGTVRGNWGKSSGPYNLIHAADSVEAVKREIELYFNTETNW